MGILFNIGGWIHKRVFVFFDCLLFYAQCEYVSPINRRHHSRWRTLSCHTCCETVCCEQVWCVNLCPLSWMYTQARIQKFFKGGGGGGWGWKFWKCLLMHVSTRVHIKTRHACNYLSLLPFQGDCLLFFALIYYILLFLKLERGVATPVSPL